MKVKVTDLERKVLEGVKKLGYKGQDARTIADVLLYAQMRGNNQGITKIATGGVPRADAVEKFRVVQEDKCGALVSGGHSMVATSKAAMMAIELAKKHGVGVVCSNHTFTSSGAIGYFARQIAKHGCIGFVSVGNGTFSFVAPTGSAEAKLGTNPFSYAFPYQGGEVVFDNATAAMAFFGVVEAGLKGEELPEGIAYDKSGKVSTDANDVLDGSVSTFAGHKGFGLSLFVQMLGSAFSKADVPGSPEKDGSGTFVLAIAPGLLAGKEEYLKRSTKLVEHIKSAKPLGGQKVYLPGEKGDEIASYAKKTGELEIADAIWKELTDFVKNPRTDSIENRK